MAEAMLGRLPLSAVRGPRDTLEELLAGPNGEHWLNELKQFVRREPAWMTYWRTLNFSDDYSFKPGRNVWEDLKHFEPWTHDNWVLKAMMNMVWPDSLEGIALHKFKVSTLGFTDFSDRELVYERALGRGYQKCPAVVGPLLMTELVAYGAKTEATMEIVMDPIGNPEEPGIFTITVSKEASARISNAYMSNKLHLVSPTRELVLMRQP